MPSLKQFGRKALSSAGSIAGNMLGATEDFADAYGIKGFLGDAVQSNPLTAQLGRGVQSMMGGEQPPATSAGTAAEPPPTIDAAKRAADLSALRRKRGRAATILTGDDAGALGTGYARPAARLLGGV
jgi:hypothetical protein